MLVMSNGRIEGILSERDVVRVLGERGASRTRRAGQCSDDAQGRELPAVGYRRPIMEMMTSGKFRHLPVVEDGKVVGLISIGDVVKWRVEGIRDRAGSAAGLHQDRLRRADHGSAAWSGVCAALDRPHPARASGSPPGSIRWRARRRARRARSIRRHGENQTSRSGRPGARSQDPADRRPAARG